MKKLLLSILLPVAIGANATSKSSVKTEGDEEENTVMSTFAQYTDSLYRLVNAYQNAVGHGALDGNASLSPYFYPMVTQGTLYGGALRQSFSLDWSPEETDDEQHLLQNGELADGELTRLGESYEAMRKIYVNSPSLVSVMESDILASGQRVEQTDVLIEKSSNLTKVDVQLAELDHEDEGEVAAIVRKPNFWKFSGSNSLNLTQNYATDNWFQGKANHYNALGMVTINANYDNKQKIQWENKLELQLGFQTNRDNDNVNSTFRPTNNLMRLNSKFGVKAAKNWYYTFKVKAETQLVQNYNYKKDSKTLITRFLNPLNIDVSLGIDWKWNLKRFSGSLNLAPLTYNVKYVELLELGPRYGIDADSHAKHTFGPSATCTFKWKIADNINWDSRLYWISNLHYSNVEFENTLSFSINKYLTSKFYFYPRFNDQSINNRMPDADGNRNGTYWMFKEWLSLGISYDW